VRRGEIWWASLPEPPDSGPGFRRPVLVIQSDDFNKSRIQTIVAVVITSNLKLEAAPGNVLLRGRTSGLKRDSVANVSQLITLDKRFLTDRVGRLSAGLLQDVESGLRLVLSLP
jgi:mRNA interferase MazF